jgi:heptosyltransferase-2
MTMMTGGRPIDKSRIRRILIRHTNWIGDAVMALPALEAVRDNFPESDITVLARPWVMPLLANHPAVDRLLPIDKRGGMMTDFGEIMRVAGRIRRRKFDLAILFQNAFEAALLAFLGGIRVRIGYNTDGRGLLLSHGPARRDEILVQHQVEYYLGILRALDWEAASREPRLFVSPKDLDSVRSLLSSEGVGKDDFLLGLSPGAAYGPAKRWPLDRFAAIGDRAVQRWGARVVLVGSAGERDLCRRLAETMKHRPLDLCGRTTLGEAMALIGACRFFVTNDSGLMHVAAALDVPMVAVFGSTDPSATGPRSRNASIVRHETACAPCLKPVCPTDYRCMLGIEPHHVWHEMENQRNKSG